MYMYLKEETYVLHLEVIGNEYPVTSPTFGPPGALVFSR